MNTETDRAGVMFDLDGTLVDTSYIHAICWWESLRQYDLVVPMATIHRAIGMGSDKLIGHVPGPSHDPSDDQAISAAHGALFAAWHSRICPCQRLVTSSPNAASWTSSWSSRRPQGNAS